MADLWMVHREEYTFSQNQLGREYAKKIADVWRGEGLIVEEHLNRSQAANAIIRRAFETRMVEA